MSSPDRGHDSLVSFECSQVELAADTLDQERAKQRAIVDAINAQIRGALEVFVKCRMAYDPAFREAAERRLAKRAADAAGDQSATPVGLLAPTREAGLVAAGVTAAHAGEPNGPRQPDEFWWGGRPRCFLRGEARLFRLLVVMWPFYSREGVVALATVNDDLITAGGAALEPNTLANYCRELSAILAGVGVPLTLVVIGAKRDRPHLAWRRAG